MREPVRSEEECRQFLAEPRIGKLVRVVSGRKVPIGTEGYVFWEGDGQYGPRVGIIDEKEEVHWTSKLNVRVVLPGLVIGEVPPEGWYMYWKTLSIYWEKWTPTLPQVGSTVLLPSGDEAQVTWTGYDRFSARLGTRTNDPLDEKTRYFSLSRIRREDGSRIEEGPVPEEPLKGVYPPPFSRAFRLVLQSGHFGVFDREGQLICRVPLEAALEIQKKLDQGRVDPFGKPEEDQDDLEIELL
jgi:hypothetical protein